MNSDQIKGTYDILKKELKLLKIQKSKTGGINKPRLITNIAKPKSLKEYYSDKCKLLKNKN